MNKFLEDTLNIPSPIATTLSVVLGITLIVFLSLLSSYVARKFARGPIRLLIEKSKNEFDDLFIKTKVLDRIALILPAFIINYLTPHFFSSSEQLITLSKNIVNCYLTIVGLLIIDALLNTIALLFIRSKLSKRFAIKGFIQAAKLIINILGTILIISFCLDKSPTLIISSFGALTAILLLIFKDTILGFVAGAQLSLNNMVTKGDWIEMPKHNADGDVMEVTLTTVKVRNWDKTITYIPAYALVAESFKNWKGMSESGGRRIKRSISIDISSIRFLNKDELQSFKKMSCLQKHIEEKEKEIDQYNASLQEDLEMVTNGRRLTNIGCFRAYCIEYLKRNSNISSDLTFLVRQLAPTEKGLPIEIYVFSKDTRWVYYEAIQADIFDHLFAILPEFKLRAYQLPSGMDLSNIIKT